MTMKTTAIKSTASKNTKVGVKGIENLKKPGSGTAPQVGKKPGSSVKGFSAAGVKGGKVKV